MSKTTLRAAPDAPDAPDAFALACALCHNYTKHAVLVSLLVTDPRCIAPESLAWAMAEARKILGK